MPPTATATATNTATNTPVPPTATATATNTPTNTPVPPTATATATNTPTNTPVPPTATATATNTPTNTPVPPTATATATATRTPTLPTSTPSATPTATPTQVTGSGFPSTGILDSFNRANSTNIGTNWTGSKSGYRIVGNKLDVGTTSDIYWRPVSYGASQEVHVTITTVDPTGLEIGLILKAQSRTGLGAGLLDVLYSPTDKTLQLWTYTSGTGWREQLPRISLALANGDRLGARALADGSVTIYVNGIARGTWNVAAWPYAASGGYIGIFTLDAPGAVLDDFGGGAVAAGAATAFEELQPEEALIEEFHMLRYKANIWLPAIEARIESAVSAVAEAVAPAATQDSMQQPERVFLPVVQP